MTCGFEEEDLNERSLTPRPTWDLQIECSVAENCVESHI